MFLYNQKERCIIEEDYKLKMTNDFIFKTVFGKKENESLLIDLLNGILNININKI